MFYIRSAKTSPMKYKKRLIFERYPHIISNYFEFIAFRLTVRTESGIGKRVMNEVTN